MTGPLFPHVTVYLSKVDGNSYSIISAVAKAIRNAGATPQQVKAFREEATSGDYDNVLQVCMKWVDIDG